MRTKRLFKYLVKCFAWGLGFMAIGIFNNVMISNGWEASNPITFADWFYKHCMCGLQFGFMSGFWFGLFFHAKWIALRHYVVCLNVIGFIMMTIMWLMFLGNDEVQDFTYLFFKWLPNEIERFKVLLMENGLGRIVPFIPKGF